MTTAANIADGMEGDATGKAFKTTYTKVCCQTGLDDEAIARNELRSIRLSSRLV